MIGRPVRLAAASILVAAVSISGIGLLRAPAAHATSAKPAPGGRPAAGANAATRTFAADSVPAVRLIPKAVTLGGSGALEVQIQMPPRSGKPKLSTLAGGTLTDPVLDDGLWIARYKPPAATSPGYDVVVAESKSGAAGIAVVQWIARAKLPVTVSRANAAISVRVGGRDFGPVQAGADQTVSIEVEIPPGAREVEVTATSAGQDPLHNVEPLALPPLERMLASVPAAAKVGKSFEATVVVLDREGAPSRVAPQVTATGGGVESVSESGPGIWKARATATGGSMALVVRGEGARARLSLKVSGAPAVETPRPTPLPMTVAPNVPPMAPTCDQLHAMPGEITTARLLKARISTASSLPDLVARRDGLLGLGCRFPDEHTVQLQLAATELLLGDDEATVAVTTPLLADENEFHEEHLALGYSYRASAELRLGRLDDAVADARTAESHMPGLYSATYTLGEAQFLRKDFPDAAAALLSAYRTAPQFASAIDHVMLAELLARRGDLEESLDHRLAAARTDPNDLAGWHSVADAAESAKAWPRAHEAWLVISAQSLPGMAQSNDANAGIGRAKSAAPKDLEIGFVSAAIEAERAKNPSKAIFLLEKALKANPKNLAARYHLALALSQSGSASGPAPVLRAALTRASQQIGSVLNDAPRWAPALILAGDIDRARGDKARAEARYRETLALSPAPPLATVARWRLDELK